MSLPFQKSKSYRTQLATKNNTDLHLYYPCDDSYDCQKNRVEPLHLFFCVTLGFQSVLVIGTFEKEHDLNYISHSD